MFNLDGAETIDHRANFPHSRVFQDGELPHPCRAGLVWSGAFVKTTRRTEAGMLRSDRTLTEKMFLAGVVPVLCCTVGGSTSPRRDSATTEPTEPQSWDVWDRSHGKSMNEDRKKDKDPR